MHYRAQLLQRQLYTLSLLYQLQYAVVPRKRAHYG